MSKILLTSTISQELMTKAAIFMMEPNHTIEEQHELLEKLTYVQHIIDEIAEQTNACTCEDCVAWTKYTGENEAFSANGGYLGWCDIKETSMQEGEFCSDSFPKISCATGGHCEYTPIKDFHIEEF